MGCYCGACETYVIQYCTCESVSEWYEASGISCAETFQVLVDEADPSACRLLQLAFDAAGGCDLYLAL